MSPNAQDHRASPPEREPCPLGIFGSGGHYSCHAAANGTSDGKPHKPASKCTNEGTKDTARPIHSVKSPAAAQDAAGSCGCRPIGP